MNAIEVSGLNTFYGKSHILHDVSLAAAEGSITTLLGRNGAGKTTTMRSIMGLTPARTGHVQVFGKDSTRLAPFRVARLRRRLRPGRTPRVRQPHGRRQSEGAARARPVRSRSRAFTSCSRGWRSAA